MALDWNKMNTKLDWSKLNTNNSTFKTIKEAKQYAEENGINYTTNLKEETPSVKLFNNEPKNIMESGKQAIAKNMVANAQEHQSVGEKFYNNVITPMNEFNSSMFYNIGALPAKGITKLALTAGEAIGGAEHPWQRAQEKTNELFGKIENAGGYNKDTTANKVGKMTGQTIQYLGMGNSLAKGFGGGVLGSALGYGATSVANAFANTNDVGDIAMEGALGGAYGAISGLTNKGIVGGIEKIFPATSPLFGGTMSTAGNVAKNVIAGAGGAYAGTATTGEARNVYNALRGREVTREDWVKPVWSTETGVTTLIGGISGGLSGTMADKQVRTKYIKDVNDLQGKLKIYAEKFNNSIQNGDEQSALDIARVSRDELAKFSMNNYGGRTVDKTAMNDLANKWKNYLENSVKYNNYMRSNAYANSNAQAQLSNPELNNIFAQYNGTNSNVQNQPNVTQETPQQNFLQSATSNAEQTITNNVPNALKNVQNQPNIVQSSQNNVQNALNFEKIGQNIPDNVKKEKMAWQEELKEMEKILLEEKAKLEYLKDNEFQTFYIEAQEEYLKDIENFFEAYKSDYETNFGIVQNALNFEKIGQNTSSELVETNIGKIPVEEYRDMMAQQAGFDDYTDMRKQGYKLGNKYDVDEVTLKNQDTISKAQKATENDQTLQPSIENTTENGYNQTGGVEDVGQNGYGLTKVVERERQNIGTAEKILKKEPQITEKELTQQQIKTKNIAKKKYNTNIVYYDGKKVDIKGLATGKNEIYIDSETATIYGSDFVLGHEIAEDMLSNHTDVVINDYDKMVEKIKNSKGFTNLFQDYTEGMSSKQKQQLTLNLDKVAKEILCDINAGKNGTSTELAKIVTNTIKNNLEPQLYNDIIEMFNKYEKQIYEKENSTQGSFLLPTSLEELQRFDNEQNKKAYESLHMKNESDTGKKTQNGFMLVNEGDTYKRTIFNNNAKAINDTIKMKSEAIVQFNQKIALKEQELASKKDKTTKVAQNLERQIINLEKRKADTEARLIKQIDMLESRNARINKLKKQVSDDRIPTRKEVRNKIITEKDLESIDLDNAKDINKFIMNNTTPQRVNEKIFDKKTADEINEKFFKPIKHNEANRIRFLNKEREEIINLGIKPKSEESAAVQMYGEGEWVNPETGESTPYTLENLKRKFPNDWEKIKNASEKIRAKYDNYLESINSKLNEMGYDSIPKRKDYFRHFEEVTSLFDAIGIPSKTDYLPTDLNGLTADLKPGKSFFANALKRTGKKTSYDAIKGIDGYLESASKLIYHTEDIQNLRTLDEYVRGKYGRNADLENLPKEEFEQRIKQIDEGHLSEYSAWLTEYTNNLAGKNSKIDRGMEELSGRRIYKTLNLLKKQVGSNLTGFNINTALSNFISAGQGLSSTSKIATLQGLIDTIANIAKNDDFIDKSDFLTTRFGSDKLSKKMWEKASESGQIFMSGTDYFTANLITRSKYHEYLNKGYPEQEAIRKADDYADRLMAGRGEGDMPNIFNSKMLGIITQFQLENVNQFDSMFHDNFTEDRASEQTKYEAKTWNEKIKSKIAKANPKFYNGIMSTFVLAELFTAGYAFNKIVKKIGGTGGAFDPIGTVEDFVKDYQKDGIEVASQNLAENILDSIPYLNFATGGGRIPMKDSLPNIYELLTGESDWKNEAWKIQNFAMPTGGGQLRKTWQGATTLINGGEYGKRKSNDGEEKEYAKWILDFDDKTPSEKLVTAMQALFFGKYGTEEAKEYLDNGYKGLTTTQTEAYKKVKETGMSAQDFKEIIEKLEKINPKKLDKTGKEVVNSKAKKAEIKEVLNNADITDEQRRILYEIYYKLNVD